MPIPKTELNKRKREQRKVLGLVEVRVWVPKSGERKIRELEVQLNKTESVGGSDV